MSSPEVERFEITEEDLNSEFNPNRRTFRQSKHQATYGMWADDSDDDDGKTGFGKKKKKNKDYTAPIAFLSGGLKEGAKPPPNEGGSDEYDSDKEFDIKAMTQGLQPEKADSPEVSGFGRSTGQNKTAQFYKSGKSGSSKDVGAWEKHTKGMGAKLMAKMGYVPGQGIGKNLQGIQTPVEAVLRKGKAAVGAYGTERSVRSKVDYPTHDSEEEEDQKFKKQLSQWKKPQQGQKKKPKYVYKTADEIIKTGGKKKTVVQSELSKVKVIDMTGKEKRVLSGYHALGHRHDMPDDDGRDSPGMGEKRAFDMPELLHNLDILVGMAEDEIIQNNKTLQYEQDLIVNLTHESEKLVNVCEHEEKQIARVRVILALVEECENRTKPDATEPITVEEVAGIFARLQDDFYEEYKVYDLAALGVAMVYPLLKTEFAEWNPLEEPMRGVETMQKWHGILAEQEGQYSHEQGFMGPYEKLVWEVWMPIMRKTVSNTWEPRSSDALIEVLETWMPLLPPWILSNVLDQLILPRIQTEVNSWNPLTDTIPIHSWLHPWLPLMGDRLDVLWDPIRHKLASALNNWHPSDPSAKLILTPWLEVWSRPSTDGFLIKNIVPKLSLAMGEFIINPQQQHLDTWNWFMMWMNVCPLSSMVAVLQKHFFPKWHRVLHTWLSSSPNYTEVTKWYTGWKQMMPDEIINNSAIKVEFNKALDTMNRAVSGQALTNPTTYQPGARENIAYLTSTERQDHLAQRGSSPAAKAGGAFVPASFKDLIEKKAEENGVLFMPLANKTQEGKQVYIFGRAQLTIDRGVIFMLDNGIWQPTAINLLIKKGVQGTR